jgi:signal transduction histidine kinase
MHVTSLFSLILSLFTIIPIVDEETNLGSVLYWHSDESNDLTPEEAINKLQQIDSKPMSGSAPNLGLTNKTGYFLVVLNNQTHFERFVLDIDYPILDHVTLYTLRKSQDKYEMFESGDLVPFKQRYRPNRTINFSVTAHKGEEFALLLKVKTSGSLQLPLRLYTEQRYSDIKTNEYIGLGTYYGFIIVMILFNGFLYLAMREKTYISYVTYLFFFLIFQTTVNGVTFQYLLPEFPRIANEMLAVSFFLAWAFAIQFSSDFLELTQKQPMWGRICKFLTWMSLVFAMTSLFVSYSSMIKIITLWGSCLPLLFFITSIKSIAANYGPARYFVAAWGIFVLGMIAFGVKAAGLLPHNFYTQYAMQIGSAAEVVLLSLALADRYRVIMSLAEDAQRQRAETQEKLLSEMEMKVIIVSDLAHRMNNPLNYITTGANALDAEIKRYHNIITEIFSDEGDDDVEARRVKSSLKKRSETIDLLLANISTGVKRTAESVESIRSLSGIDGTSLKFVPCQKLIEAALHRATEVLGPSIHSRVTLQSEEHNLSEAFVNYYAVIVVLERILDFLLVAHTDTAITITVRDDEEAADNKEPFLTIALETMAHSSLPLDNKLIRPLNTLLSPFSAAITSFSCGARSGFLVKLPKSCATPKEEAQAC